MTERSYRFAEVDKAGWGDGPWRNEPDKVVWVDDATGLDCMIVRNRVGGLCGYVGVPAGHPWFEADYDSIEPYPDVHGGLTFADHCSPGKREDEYSICHDATGRPDNVWWLGFDCIHYMDYVPAYRAMEIAHPVDPLFQPRYRDLAYVKAEVERLAGQAAGVAS